LKRDKSGNCEGKVESARGAGLHESAKFEVRNAGSYFFGVKIVNAGTCERKVDIPWGSDVNGNELRIHTNAHELVFEEANLG
jgi:hypothetical protein